MNRVIERPLAPPQSHFYEIALAEGQCLQIIAASQQLWLQLGVDRGVAKPVAWDTGEGRAPSSLGIALIAPETARYRISVSAHGATAPGAYQLLVTLPPNPPPEFFARAQAQRLAAQLSALYYEQRNKEAFLAMPEVGEEAGRLFGLLGMRRMQTEALNLVGEAWRQLGEWARASEAFERTLEISRAIGHHEKEAEALTFIGMCWYQTSDYRRAIAAYREALPAWDRAATEVGSRPNMVGWTLTQLGNAQLALGDLTEARVTFEQAKALYQQYRATGAAEREWRFGAAFCMRGLARIHSLVGEKQQAIDALTAALEHYRGAGDDYYAPLLLNDLGELYASLGERGQAFDLYEQALRLEQRMGSRATEAQTLYLLGRWHAAANALDEAERHLQQALSIRRGLRDRRGMAATLHSLGELAAARRAHGRALELYAEALAIQRKIGDRYGEGFALNGGGVSYAALGDAARAREWLNAALAVRRALGDREGEAQTLYQLARLMANTGARLDEARALIEAALRLTEFIRAGVLSQELRAYYLSTVSDYYEFYTELLMRQHERAPNDGHQAEALRAAELARARSLLELLAEAQVDIRADAAPDLLARERELRQRLSAQLEYQLRLQTGLLPVGEHTAAELAGVAKKAQRLNLEYQDVRARLRAASPRYAALTQPQPLSAAEMQHLLDADTVLLEYALGTERSFLWAVTREQVTSYVLPPRAQINAAARRVYDLLTARNRFDARETAAQRRARIARADAEFPEAARVLSQMALAPASRQLGRKRLLIVAQEALLFVPFAALPLPETGGRGDGAARGKNDARAITPSRTRPIAPSSLIEKHEIVYLPSASVLRWLRPERERAPKTVAVLADPVFSRDDAWVLAAGASASPREGGKQNVALLRALQAFKSDAESQPELRVERLPGTRWEAEQIAALVPATERLQALNFAANRALATGAELSRYRIVHLATHALINTAQPALSGLVFSLVDEQGQPQDGFLSVHEVFNLRLAADLVVLSACQTGLGKEVRGEGLVGLTQGFLYAGAPRVVVSLWALQDKPTAMLISRFYQRLLREQPSAPPAALLRAVQLEMKRSGRWPSPYFWAGFTLQGDYQ